MTDRVEPPPKFDADFSLAHPTNQEAAKVRGLRFGSRKGYYVDEDGCLIRDEFGQPL